MKTLSKYLDKHRLILTLLILLIISIIFILVSLLLFLNHDFEAYECTKNKDEEICLYKSLEIFKNPIESKDKFFLEYQDEIKSLVKEYNLPEFNFYTAYYYELASNFDYQKNKRNETLNRYFKIYSNTYNLEKFYKRNNHFFSIFYPYKII